MQVSDTRKSMLACVDDLRIRLANVTDIRERDALVNTACASIEQLRKEFQRAIDSRSNSSGGGFAINERAGICRRLAEATAEALAGIKVAADNQ